MAISINCCRMILFQVAIEKLKLYPVDKLEFEEELWKAKIHTPVVSVHSKGQKHERIISLEPEVKKGHILFNAANIRYNNQIKDYN
ncbi:hypothetical protein [Paenibacillus polymyxa]|uniref:Uncharacterized protein n=1 Tax=Paenibacillus polymyxa (strain SC2) TaxID=886882 RepID=E3EFS8_PAEPS|nr:hypothetical protein [Paenibacillus polymyxa]ADO55800.2 hypothetical protein PPSC2_08625 [Paenibacillus polymyxa SC2]WPQ58526.1 hypothetical protein SKN87_08785 [Paenibacillus polymyxa]CCC84575.1 hypothetical protein PPM_1638 [Paenibacillus polymyxa M1]